MQKTILLVICLFTGIHLYGQVNENGFVIRLDGNFNETTTGNTLQYVNSYDFKSKNRSISASLGYMYRHWLFGLGFEYNRNKSDVQGGLFQELGYDGYGEYGYGYGSSPENPILNINSSYELGTVTLNSYGGMLYANRYIPLYHNLYFTPGFYLGYGAIKGNYSGDIVTSSFVSFPNDYISYGSLQSMKYETYEQNTSFPYFYMQLSPELTWFFSNHFGLSVQMGGIGITVVDSDWRNSSKQIDFNPSLWKLGLIFKM